jgi:hypothetical protein
VAISMDMQETVRLEAVAMAMPHRTSPAQQGTPNL